MQLFVCISSSGAQLNTTPTVFFDTTLSTFTFAISGSPVGGSETVRLDFFIRNIYRFERDNFFLVKVLFYDPTHSKNLNAPWWNESQTVFSPEEESIS